MPTTSSARPSRSARRGDGPARPTFRENVWYWVKAIVAILILRAFIAEPYRIPSESMEDTLLVGDFLIVSKLHWGPRTPATLGIPVTGLYLPGLEVPQVRLPGFTEPERGDVVVFNYPASQDVERGVIPASVPIERRSPYIKRITAVPGDTFAVLDKVLHVNGQPVPLGPTLKQRWRAVGTGDARPNARQLEEMGIELLPGADRVEDGARVFEVFATPPEVEALAALPLVARVEPFVLDERYVDGTFGANPDHVPPRVVPAAGLTVPLTEAALAVYGEAITRHEGHRLERAPGGGVVLDGAPATSFTFTQDYYMAMGDARDNSVDSRYWGFVPHSHLVGKAVFTFLSFKGEFPFVRPTRFFRPIP
ncbi:signal peptidase I [Rubrivirga sp.]|uniref:signal peptidase I n=1 Tax=Rubrivirga sp. TaxID=1885344 RepID=UPI003B52B503